MRPAPAAATGPRSCRRGPGPRPAATSAASAGRAASASASGSSRPSDRWPGPRRARRRSIPRPPGRPAQARSACGRSSAGRPGRSRSVVGTSGHASFPVEGGAASLGHVASYELGAVRRVVVASAPQPAAGRGQPRRRQPGGRAVEGRDGAGRRGRASHHRWPVAPGGLARPLRPPASSSRSDRGDRRRHPPPGLGQRVEVAELQPAPGPDRREQRGEVVVEVVDGRASPARGPAASQPAKLSPSPLEGDEALAVRRMNMTRAPVRSRPTRPVPVPARAAGAVRVGSMANQVACRVEHQPVGRPASHGELAKAATSVGPEQVGPAPAPRGARPRPRRASRLTCTAAVRVIITRPSGPSPSKNASMAS